MNSIKNRLARLEGETPAEPLCVEIVKFGSLPLPAPIESPGVRVSFVHHEALDVATN